MNKSHSLWLFFACCIVSLLLGCMSQPGTTKLKVTMYQEASASKPPKSPIAIYSISHPPERDYEEIARIEASNTDEDWNFVQTIHKALELGADGVIMGGRPGKDYGFISIAIRYR